MSDYQKGMTLIELMIAVAIVGILAAIAWPNYSRYMESSRRSAGQALLQEAMARQETYYGQHMTYASSVDELYGQTTYKGEYYELAVCGNQTGCGNEKNKASDMTRMTATPLTDGPQQGDGVLWMNSEGDRGRIKDGKEQGGW